MPLSQPELNAFRAMAPADKLGLISRLYLEAKTWKRAMLRSQHPDWTPEQIETVVKELFLRGSS